MRRSIFWLVMAASVLASDGHAQGWVVPGPCSRCPTVTPWRVVRTSSAVRATLANGVLRYEIEEHYTNRGAGLGEAEYYFPLPGTAAFEDLRLSINGELVSGEVMDAARARGVYESIVRQERDPALVEWMGHGLLHARIFPIAPGEDKRVVVRFQMVAQREGDAVRIDYRRPAAVRGAPADDPMSETSFTLRYAANGGFGQPYSPTHSLDVRTDEGMRTVETRGAGRDVTILLPVPRTRAPAISMIATAPDRDSGFALITIAPPAVLPAPLPRDVTFVLDVSGSMSGRKIAQARDAGRALLATLRPEDRFRVIDFSTDVHSFRDAFAWATRANVDAAGSYIDDLRATGSTNLEGALRAALAGDAAAGGRRLGIVVLITDGEPTVGEQSPDVLARYAAEHRGARRVFTFGLGADVNTRLVEQLALEGRGTAGFLAPEENIEHAVSVLADRLRDPVLADVRIHAKGIRLADLMPAEPPDLFAGQSIVLLARYTGHGRAQLRVEGSTASGSNAWTADVDFPERSSANAFIPRLWATQRVGWLSAERHKNGPSPEVDAELRALGERYGIPTELTSYLVREPVVATAIPVGARRGYLLPATVAPRAKAFDQARQATAMRASESLAAADSAAAVTVSGLAVSSPAVRRVGDRVFTRRADSVWVDGRYDAHMRVIRVQAYSAAYFEIARSVPGMAGALSLGEEIIVAGRTVAVQVGAAGTTELSAADRATLRKDW